MASRFAAALAAMSLWTGADAMRPLVESGNGTEAADDPMDACRVRAHPDVALSAGWSPPFAQVASVGTIHGFMIFIDFSDAAAVPDSAPGVYDFIAPGADEFLRNSSYGQLSLAITADTAQIYRMPAPMADYEWTLDEAAHRRYVQDALDAYLAADEGRTEVPVADVLYIVAPPNAAKMWNSLAAAFTPWTRAGQFVATRVVTLGLDAYFRTGAKTLAHETGHSMALPDYYPTDREHALGHFVAGFSLMGDSSEQGPDHFAWDKWRLGWLPDAAVACVSAKGSTTHTLAPVEEAPAPGKTQAVVVAVSATRVLVAEARARRGADAATLCADAAGVLLYTVDTRVPSGRGPVRVLGNAPERRTCGAYPANRAALSLDAGRSAALAAAEFGVTVTLLAQEPEAAYTIRVDYL